MSKGPRRTVLLAALGIVAWLLYLLGSSGSTPSDVSPPSTSVAPDVMTPKGDPIGEVEAPRIRTSPFEEPESPSDGQAEEPGSEDTIPGWALLIRFEGPGPRAATALVSLNASLPPAAPGVFHLYPPVHRKTLSIENDAVLVESLKDPVIDVRVRVQAACPVFFREVRVEGSSRRDPVVRTAYLGDGGSVFGEVVIDEGASIPAQAAVVAWRADAQVYAQAFTGGGGQMPPVEDQAFHAQRMILVDELSPLRFDVTGLLPGDYRIGVFPKGLPPRLLGDPIPFTIIGANRVGPLTIHIHDRPSLKLRVVVEGTPIPCFVSIDPLGERVPSVAWRRSSRRTDPKGQATFANVAPGAYRVRVTGGLLLSRLGVRQPPSADNVLNAFLKIALKGREEVLVEEDDLDLGTVELADAISSHERWLSTAGETSARLAAANLLDFTPEGAREEGIDPSWVPHLLVIRLFAMSNARLARGSSHPKSTNPHYAEMMSAWKAEKYLDYIHGYQRALQYKASMTAKAAEAK